MSFREFSGRVNQLGDRIRQDIQNCDCMEDAAKKFTSAIYREFSKSFVLSRLFITVPFCDLPDTNKTFVEKLAVSKGLQSQLQDNTPVLSLLGTCGQNGLWNDRNNSSAHIGIPLLSEAFIDAIPMMSRLLKELGIRISWLENFDSRIVTQKNGSISGLFYVEDAAESLDEKGRKIISEQDFVSQYQVRTVFGMGGQISIARKYVVMINFLNRNLPQKGAELFIRYINIFNGETGILARDGKIFGTQRSKKNYDFQVTDIFSRAARLVGCEA
ncbi:MAG TPA: hypothetical protein DCQ37_04785 [Desulfobacteraceae bacterium]|nr:hypothetical protein [Desulfobacteraceae bacterium]